MLADQGVEVVLPEGARIGGIELERKIAEGGMGIVYKGRSRSGTVFALKVMRPDMVAVPSNAERFERECGFMEELSHDHIIRCHEHGTDWVFNLQYAILQFFPSIDLADYIARVWKQRKTDFGTRTSHLPLDQVYGIALQIGRAIGHAHEHDIVHRDVKPENILVAQTSDGTILAMLTDFGVAIRDTEEDARARITHPHAVVGTPGYMAPEQSYGQVDRRSDIWSFGGLLYHMVVGEAPFGWTGDIHEYRRAVQNGIPSERRPRVLVPDLDPIFDGAITAMLDPDPGKRPQTIEEAAWSLWPRSMRRHAPSH